MANSQIIILVSSLLLSLAFQSLATLPINYHEEVPLKKISVIEGRVYCQSCKEWKTWSLSSDAKPLPLARVSVTCTNHDDRIIYYKEYVANENGYFFAKLDGYSMGNNLFNHPLDACKVKLVSSPDESCNVPSKFNNGITGASLRREHRRLTKNDCEYKYYDAGSLAFRPAICTSEETNY